MMVGVPVVLFMFIIFTSKFAHALMGEKNLSNLNGKQ
jgi:hypothetical protein